MRILVKKKHECECEYEYSNMCIRMHSNANTEYEYPMPGQQFNIIGTTNRLVPGINYNILNPTIYGYVGICHGFMGQLFTLPALETIL